MPIDRDSSSHSITASLNAAGVGRFQFYLLAYTGLAWAGDACETMLLSYLGPSVVCYWGPDVIGPFQESLLTAVVFAGMMFGVGSLGIAADVLGRRKGFFLSATVLGIAGVASAAAPSFGVLLLLRSIVGAALGGTPIAVTLFTEFLPTSRRGSLVLLLQSAWSVGTVVESCLAWLILPTLGWRWLLLASALPMLILLGGYPWLPESPHWLASQGRIKEAEDVVARVARVNNTHLLVSPPPSPPPWRPSPSPPASSSSHQTLPSSYSYFLSHPKEYIKSTLSNIFSLKLAKTTTLLWCIWFVNALTYYGLVLLTTNLQQQQQASSPLSNSFSKNEISDLTESIDDSRCTTDGNPNFKSSDYLAVLITSAAEAPGLLIAALFIDGKGRVWCLRLGLLVCSGCVLALVAVPSNSSSTTSESSSSWSSRSIQLALLFISRAAIEASFSVLYVYTPELYATRIRAQGLALCNAFSRLGGFLAPFATVYLVESGRAGAAEMLLGVLLLLAAAAAFALPYETKGIDLGEEMVVGSNVNSVDEHGSNFRGREEERERLISQQQEIEVP